MKLRKATKKLRDKDDAKSERDAKLLARVRDRVAKEGMRRVAQAAGIDGGNLSRLLRGKRSASSKILAALTRTPDIDG
jgi:DNA-binding phage protein